MRNALIRDAIFSKFYVDNFTYTHNDPNVLEEVLFGTSEAMKKSGFNLREWNTNCSSIKNSLPEHKVCDSDTSKIVGYVYNSELDSLTLKSKILNLNASTKRTILSSISQIFNPLGVISPLTVALKLFMQKLHALRSSWDCEVGEDLSSEWKVLANKFNSVQDLTLPRMAFKTDKPIELVAFCDASKKLYNSLLFTCNNRLPQAAHRYPNPFEWNSISCTFLFKGICGLTGPPIGGCHVTQTMTSHQYGRI